MVNFDVNLSIGRWPFRPLPHESMPDLVRYLRPFGITGGLVRSAEGAFSADPEMENRRLADACRDHAGFLPLPVANPFYGYWKSWKNIPAAVLYPGFQCYQLLAQETLDMAHCLAVQGTRVLAVVVRQEDDRAQHPLCRIPAVQPGALETFAWNLPETTVIALNCCSWEAQSFTAPNLYADTAFIEGFPALAPAGELLKRERVLFGSHAPFFCVSAGLAKVAALSEKEQAAIQQAAERLL